MLLAGIARMLPELNEVEEKLIARVNSTNYKDVESLIDDVVDFMAVHVSYVVLRTGNCIAICRKSTGVIWQNASLVIELGRLKAGCPSGQE